MRHDFATSLAWAIVTGIMVASSYGLNSVGFSMQRLAQIPMATWCNEAVNSYLYHQEPKELENSDTGDQARQARDAIDSGSLTLQAFSLLSLISSAIVCISLTVTIWRSSWVSAVLVLLSLFPSVIEYMVFADVEQKQWPKIMKVSRRARYFEDILTYEKPAVELAHDAAGGYVAGLASQGYRRRSRMSRRLELVDLFLALAATAMTAVLIIFALVALVDAHAPVAMVAGTVVGVLSGISATSDVGYELGNMIRASVSISGFLHMLDADSAASSHADSRVDSAAPAKVVGLDVDDLSAFYDQERRIGVSGVSIHARKGQIVAFVGRNGAGKTTTVKALTGMLAPEQGIITLALEGEKGTPQGRNLDLGSMVFFSRRPYMSVMVQNYNRFELTVRQTWLWGRFGISLRGRGRSPKSRTAGSCGMLWTRSGRRRSWRGSHRESIPSWARSGTAWTFPVGNGNG